MTNATENNLTRNPTLSPEFDIMDSYDSNAKFDFWNQNNANAPEKDVNRQLWYDVLKQGLQDFMEYDTNTYEFRDAFNWFFNEPKLQVGSFYWICQELDIEKNTIIKRLTKFAKINLKI